MALHRLVDELAEPAVVPSPTPEGPRSPIFSSFPRTAGSGELV